MNRYILDDIAIKSKKAKEYVTANNNNRMSEKWSNNYKKISYNMRLSERVKEEKEKEGTNNANKNPSKGLALNPMVNIATYTALKGHGMSKMLSKLKEKPTSVDKKPLKNSSSGYVAAPFKFNRLLDTVSHDGSSLKNFNSFDPADGSNLVSLYDDSNYNSHHSNKLSDNLLLIGGLALCMMLL